MKPGEMNSSGLFDRWLNALAFAASLLIFVSWGIVCMEIVMRYFFRMPLTWAVEFTEYIMLYSTFLGAAWLLKEEGHVKVDLLFNRLRPRSRAMLNFITSLIGMAACATVVWYGSRSTISHYREGIRTFSALLLLKWPFLIVIPFGTLLLSVQFIRRAAQQLREWKALKN